MSRGCKPRRCSSTSRRNHFPGTCHYPGSCARGDRSCLSVRHSHPSVPFGSWRLARCNRRSRRVRRDRVVVPLRAEKNQHAKRSMCRTLLRLLRRAMRKNKMANAGCRRPSATCMILGCRSLDKSQKRRPVTRPKGLRRPGQHSLPQIAWTLWALGSGA